jgi:hypothetical protein
MNHPIEVDVWVRGTHHAATRTISSITRQPESWTDADVRQLLSEMLLALEREKNPGGDAPEVTLRGFSWIVTADGRSGGVLLHLEMQMGTASAGPFAIDQARLTDMVREIVSHASGTTSIH